MGQVSKLAYVDRKLGAPANGQQTTRIIFDTEQNAGAVVNQVDFFTDFQGKTPGQTNLQVSKLDSSESMVIKSVWFSYTNNDNSAFAPFPGANGGATMDIIVGNQTVVKALPLHFNSTVGEPYDRLHGSNNGVATGTAGAPGVVCEYRLLTNIVIPPQVDFKVVVKGADLFQAAGGSDENTLICALIGYGQLFSAGGTF
jgi:hypothetical protein